MRALSFLLLVAAVAATALSASPAAPPSREIDNVAAFARLFGVARYFYPSDAAAELDWNRFAVHGVAQVRPAGNTEALRVALDALFAPLGPGIEIGPSLPAPGSTEASSETLVAWRYLGAGFSAGGGYSPYKAKRTNRAPPGSSTEGFATLTQTMPAEDLRGKAVRMRAQVRARPADPSGAAALWLRVDRLSQTMGFFDNMGDRPIREPEWREYTIEGSIDDDAFEIAFGVMALGAVTADFDAVELAVKDAEGDWTLIPIGDAGFEATTENGEHGEWSLSGPRRAAVSRPGEEAPEGRQFCRFAPPPPAATDEELFDDPAPTPGAHVDLDLGSGLKARVALTLTDSQACTDAARQARLDELTAALAVPPKPGGTPDPDQRLADVVVAWNVFRHFYPYWTEAGVDWDTRLRPRLEGAHAAETRAAQHDVLRGLAADLRDGHAGVRDTLKEEEQAELPVRLAVIDDRLVVTASSVPTEAPVGAVVSTIDGTPARDWLARAMSLVSGTTQWRQVRVLWRLTSGPRDGTVRLGLDTEAGPSEVTLSYAATQAPPEKRPEPVAELEPGVWYVDLTRAKMEKIAPKLDALGAARGVVFDVRGYPTEAGARILPHLLDAPETDRWMHVAKIVGPFGQSAGWESFGWDLKPAAPRIAGTVVFLTDNRAISYSESVMGYVADRKRGTVVGATTAGTNGNVATFTTPGGFSMRFTGMYVTGHDGKTPLHLVGIAPDIAAVPTVEGLRAGRDEVLERGLAVVRAAVTEGGGA